MNERDKLVLELIEQGKSHRQIKEETGLGLATISRIRNEYMEKRHKGREFEVNGNEAKLTIVTKRKLSVDEILKCADVDLSVWEPYRHIVNSWDVTIKNADGEPQTVTNWQTKVWLTRIQPEAESLKQILDEIKQHCFVIPRRKYPRPKGFNRELEISILDPHLGMECFKPGADHNWNSEKCAEMVMMIIDKLVNMSEPYGPFDRIVFPWGNDFLHCDGVFHTTTQGTPQPEAKAWQQIYVEAKHLAIEMIEALKEKAPVLVIVVFGNHARQSEFTLGQLLEAYYHRDQNVTVKADRSPYKFHHYGINLIGFEHGHSIKQQARLAALMANECRDVWSQTVYREWHLGDQHRKGSSKPCLLEEQGVSVEFLPGLVVPNEWHRLKSYNWQKRGAMAYVWDKTAGPIARLQVNINSYTGEIMQ